MGDEACAYRGFCPDLDAHRIWRDHRNRRLYRNRCAGVGHFADFLSCDGFVSLLGKMSPISFLRNIREPQLLAFSISTSAAVMPLSLETAEKKLPVEPSVARFIIPLGATINMDGTALYQVTAAVFLTQVFGVHLDIWGLIGLAGTPPDERIRKNAPTLLSSSEHAVIRRLERGELPSPDRVG